SQDEEATLYKPDCAAPSNQRDSQRKTPVVVSFRDGERMFGEAAASVGVRFPSKVYQYSLDLLGKSLDHPLVADYLVKYPYYKLEAVQGPNGSFVFVHPEGKLKLTPEEIMAMMLRHARNIATNAAGQPVKEAVITVPPYFGQAERQALQSAAQLANINLLQLINSNTAAALNYGVFRRKDFNESTPSIILFFDMGAGSTVATIAAYQLVKSKERGYTETNPQLTIKGVGFDRTMGGLEIQLRLREHLAKLFKEQTGLDATSSPRSMAKLLKEAGRLKKVLSANAEHIAQVENLMEEKDFRATITRTQLEDLIPDYAARIQAVVQAALKSAGLTLEEVEQVVLAGSSTRVPHVQQALQTATGRSDLSKSLNTDEAAAMGAAYQAAHLSKGFKVKTFLVRDLNLYPIQVEFSREMEGTGEIKAFKRLLFPHGNPYPQKKVMTFRSHVKDFDLQVNYADLDFLPEQDIKRLGSTNLMNLAITGVAEALAKHSEDESKGVKAYFRLDESGLINFEHAEAQFEKTVQEEEAEGDLESAFAKLGNTIGKLFSGGSSSQDEPAPTAEPPVEENAAKSNDTQGDRPVKVVTLKEPLKDQKAKLDFMGLSQDELKASAKK
ncbi:HYOU1, partial [Cordylochernes scorpioides]